MDIDGGKIENNVEAQDNFKLKLRNFQAKVKVICSTKCVEPIFKTTLDSLVKERNELKERVKELEVHFIFLRLSNINLVELVK